MNLGEKKSVERINAFLAQGLWPIGHDRLQTKAAIVEFLSVLPVSVLEDIFRHLHILVAAPARHLSSACVPWSFTVSADACFRGQVILFDSRLEIMPYSQTLKEVGWELSFAMARVAGLPEDQALRAANERPGTWGNVPC